MKTLVIERDALKNNIGVVKERAGRAVIYGVLTGDGQGAGLVELAKALRAEGIGRFAVSEVSEAAALRKAGFVEEEILMLRSVTDREELEGLLDLNVVCTIGSLDAGLALNAVAEGRSTVAEAHIQIDTGMGFGGFLASEPEKLLSVYRSLPNVAVSGLCTQLHTLKKDGRDLDSQLADFTQAVEAIHAAGFETGLVHAAGSYALPVSIYFFGALIGMIFVRRASVTVPSAVQAACRALSVIALVTLLVAAVPYLLPEPPQGMTLPAVLFWSVLGIPLVSLVLGFAYALAWAPITGSSEDLYAREAEERRVAREAEEEKAALKASSEARAKRRAERARRAEAKRAAKGKGTGKKGSSKH